MSSIIKKKRSTSIAAAASSAAATVSSSSISSSTLTNNKDSIINLERSLRSLLLKDTINSNNNNNNNNDQKDSTKGDINTLLELSLEAINKQQWRRIDELNFIDAAENSFPDLNVYRTIINNDNSNNNDNNNNNNNNNNNKTLDAILNQYNRIILKMNELKHLDKSRVKNLYSISKLIDDINTKKGKSYNLKHVLNISVKRNNEKFQNKLGKDKKNTKLDSMNSLTNLEMQIEALNDAEFKAIQSRKNEQKFWNILDKNLNKYDDILKSSSSTSSSESMKELEHSISNYIDMISKLENAVQSFMISGISYENMEKISNKVNTEIYSEMFEKMIKEMDNDGYDHKDDNNYRENILARNNYINIDKDSIMYRYLQSQWKVPLRNVKPALETLRSRHKDMLMKIAKATQPHSPYEFLFK